MAHDDGSLTELPREPVDRITGPLMRFLHVEAAGGVVLLVFTIAALALANSPASESFLAFWKIKVGFSVGSFTMVHSLQHWINDGLMSIFFFVVGLEVKRELVLGELSDPKRVVVPIAAALGGMVVPAGIYLALQPGAAEAGWGIPMATDIAFVAGCLALLGSRVPKGLRVFLISLAIVDDIGAILVIAIGYTEQLSWGALLGGVAAIAAILGAARLGIRSIPIYVFLGSLVWFGFHESGVHATIAGVILGLLTPTRSWVDDNLLAQIVSRSDRFLHGEWRVAGQRRQLLGHVQTAAREALSPLERLENGLHPWVSFGIMPLFAFANAGVEIEASRMAAPVAIAVLLGLFVGKPLGILVFSWAAVASGRASLPDGVSWSAVLAGGFLAGIGFTMALFIASLALAGPELDAAKIGILEGSALSAVIGMVLLAWIFRRPPTSRT